MALLKSWLAGDQLLASDLNNNDTELGKARFLTLQATEAISINAACALKPIQSDDGIKFDTGGTGNASGANGTINNIPITIGANSNRILMVQIAAANVNGAFSISFNGIAPTSTLVTNEGNGANHWIYLWNAPTTGTRNLTITISNANGLTYNVAYLSLYNVSQTAQPSQNNHPPGGGAGNSPASITLATPGSIGILCVAGSTGSLSTTGIQVNAQSNVNAYMAWSGIALPLGPYGGSRTATNYAAYVAEFQPANSVTGYGVCNASSLDMTYRYATYLGIASAAVAAGASLDVITDGKITGLSSLAPGAYYYLNDTSGTIGTSPGTNTRKVGFAISTTSLLLTNNF
jgi:hypothetical protein